MIAQEALDFLNLHADKTDIIIADIFAYIPKPWDTAQLIDELDKAVSIADRRIEKTPPMEELSQQLRGAGIFQRSLFRIDIPREPLIGDVSVYENGTLS